MTDSRQPDWLDGPCPDWCAREHREDDHPEDRYHQSEPSLVPAVAGSGDGVPVTVSLGAVTLTVRTGRYAGADATWLVVEALEGREPRLVLTAESARALAGALRSQLDGLGDTG